MSETTHKQTPETRERILDAAEGLFMAHGFEATSMRMITGMAHVNLAAVNYHFGTKDALIHEVFRRRLRDLNRRRLAALSAEINGLGGNCVEIGDGLVITAAPLHGGTWHSYADHRMATAGAIIGLTVPGVAVEDIATTAKTLPDFPGLWAGMLKGTSGVPEGTA